MEKSTFEGQDDNKRENLLEEIDQYAEPEGCKFDPYSGSNFTLMEKDGYLAMVYTTGFVKGGAREKGWKKIAESKYFDFELAKKIAQENGLEMLHPNEQYDKEMAETTRQLELQETEYRNSSKTQNRNPSEIVGTVGENEAEGDLEERLREELIIYRKRELLGVDEVDDFSVMEKNGYVAVAWTSGFEEGNAIEHGWRKVGQLAEQRDAIDFAKRYARENYFKEIN